MNQQTEQRAAMDRDRLLEWVMKWYHIPVLIGLLAFMFWNRMRTWRQFVTDNGVFFSGNDAWYHLRQTTYTVHNWPWTMPFDPWTHFPVGTASGQFGTFYDQIVATVALIVGLGNPDQGTISLTLLFAPAAFGALTMIPVYLITRRVSGRLGGVTAALVLALTAGSFLQRTLVGFSDHHAAEAFFQALAILGLMVAFGVAKEEKPVYELLSGRETDALRRPIGASVLAGVALALYIWVWPPGIMIAAVLSAFFVVQLSLDYLRGQSPEHTALVGIGAFVVAAVLVASRISTLSFTATDFSLLQPALLGGVALGLVVMTVIARWFDATGTDRRLYPVVILSGIALAVGTVALLFPDLYSYMVSQSLRFIGLSTTAAQRTVTEAQPLNMDPNAQRNYWGTVMDGSYGLAFYLAIVGVFVVLVRIATDDDTHPEQMLLVVWGTVMTLAVFTQVRFNYYFALPVAIFTGYFVGSVADFLGLDAATSIDDIEIHQFLTVLTVIFLITTPLIAFGNSSATGQPGSQGLEPLTTQAAENNAPDGVPWQSSLAWLSNNTPEEGRYDNPNGTPMEYYGEYDQTDDYQYPDGAYGVMAWWDYGHWITTRGERIPNANPFQQGAQEAADFLLETDENEATELLEGEEPTRYVMVDWQIVSVDSKYSAPTQFESNDTVSAGDLAVPLYQEHQQTGTYRTIARIPTQRHLESMRTRMYRFNGSAVEPDPVVFDWDEQPVQTPSGDQTIRTLPSDGSEPYKEFDNMSAARDYVEQDGSSQIGLGTPSEPIPALKHYRMVHASKDVGPQSVNNQPWVKTFERVPGATVNGTGPANTTVTANVTMQMPTTDETFTYKQHAETDEQGEFTMTLPYSTTGYDEWGPESGHTNVSVRATGPYTFSTNATNTTNESANASDEEWTGTANVTEGQVIGKDDSAVEVTLQQNGNGNTNETANTSPAVDSTEMLSADDVGTDGTGPNAQFRAERKHELDPRTKVA